VNSSAPGGNFFEAASTGKRETHPESRVAILFGAQKINLKAQRDIFISATTSTSIESTN
jgi:hypothetical protein